MATRTGKPQRRIPFGRIASWLIGVPLVLGILTAFAAAALRGNPSWFVALSDRLMPRTAVETFPGGPEGDAAFFKYGAIGNEAADGIPLKIWSVLPDVCPALLRGRREAGYKAFGFTYEPDREGRERATPIGLSRTRLGLAPLEIEVLAINCATCHVQTYRLPGETGTRIFTGGASNRLDAQGYTRFLAACAESDGFETDTVMSAIVKRYPETGLAERLMFRHLVVPVTRSLLRERLGTRFHWTWSRPDWGPGRLSPFNPVKFDYLRQPLDETIDHSDVMPAWNVTRKQQLRSPTPWHWDGLSWDLREVVVNSALGDGVTRFGYREQTIDRLMRYLQSLESPKAPIDVDPLLRAEGERIFERECANCHAPTGERVMTIIPRAEIGTDPGRLDMWTPRSAAAYNNYDKGGTGPAFPWTFEHFQKHDGYLAQPLDGIWLTGPYLHNGSVPTLDDLLKPARERQRAFERGGEEIDFAKGGYLAAACSPKAYRSAGKFCFDTSRPGNSNAGHEYGTTLSAADRAALVHFLLTQ
jgi:hypothetical protein